MNFYRNFSTRIGLLKSIAIYYWKPFNQYRLKRFYRQFIQQGDLCFDIGAHVGNRTQAWLNLGARVIAVEPQPVCVRYMKRRFAGKSEVTILEEAVGREEGEKTLHISSSNPTISTLSDDSWRARIRTDAKYPIRWDTTIQVRMTTLDILISKYGVPAFCKIDVENTEFEVLSGLRKPIPVLSFEYYPPSPDNTYRCLERLEALGSFEFNWSLGETLKLASPKWISCKAMKDVLEGYRTRYEYGDIYARSL